MRMCLEGEEEEELESTKQPEIFIQHCAALFLTLVACFSCISPIYLLCLFTITYITCITEPELTMHSVSRGS